MRMGLSEYEDDEFKADMSEGTVLDRLATPEEIAKNGAVLCKRGCLVQH